MDAGQCYARLREFGHRADDELAPIPRHAAQLGDPAEIDDLRRQAQFLGDPQPDVRGAGDQHRVRMFFDEAGEFIRGGWRPEFVAAGFDEDRLAILKGLELRGDLVSRLCNRLREGFERRVHDRPISGAATEIAGERIVDAGGGLLFVE